MAHASSAERTIATHVPTFPSSPFVARIQLASGITASSVHQRPKTSPNTKPPRGITLHTRPASAGRGASERRIRDSNTPVRDASVRPSNLCRLKRCESLAGASGERDDRLPLVAVEGLAQSGGGLVTATGRFEHLGEVGERLALFQEGVAPQREVDCFAGQAFHLGVLPARGVD